MASLKLWAAPDDSTTLETGSSYEHPGLRPRVQRMVEPRTGIVTQAGDAVAELVTVQLTARVTGTNEAGTQAAMHAAIAAAQRMTRFYDGVRFLRVSQPVIIGKTTIVYGVTGLVPVTFDLLDPYWHLTDVDNSTRLVP